MVNLNAAEIFFVALGSTPDQVNKVVEILGRENPNVLEQLQQIKIVQAGLLN